MKPASPALIALMARRQFYVADLFNFSLVGGSQLNYCSGERDINWNSITWSAGGAVGPYLDRKQSRAKCHWKVGVEVDTLVFDVLPGAAAIGGIPFLSFVRKGGFDGAEMTLYRAFMPTYGDVAAGTVIMFAGRVAEVEARRSLAAFTINSHLELLNQNMPRNVYQSGCVNTLFDSACGLAQGDYAVNGTAGAGSTASVLSATLAQPTAYFDLGQITGTSGVNSGFSRTVQTYIKGTPGTISLMSPFPSALAQGDTFQIFPGCDKLHATCAAKFSNLIHFRGCPFIPQPETAI